MPRVNTPAPPITGDCFRMQLGVLEEAQQCIFTCDYMGAGFLGPTNADMLALQTAWLAIIQGPLAAVIANTAATNYASTQLLSTGTTPTLVQLVGGVGLGGALCSPLEVSAIISFQSALKGQHGIGRRYIPAVPQAFCNTAAGKGSQLTAAAVTAYQALAFAMLTNVAAGAFVLQPAVFTRPVSPAFLVTRASLLLTSVVRPILGTVRRRRIGRGI
jgi:hypothetical protein